MISAQEILNASILIVDDQQSNVMLLEQLLSEVGYTQVASTTEPVDVFDLHRKNHYDLILLDLHMPGMDGFQVMEGLKGIEIDGYLPVLVITAQPAHKLRALAAGAKDFVAKPFDLIEVRTRIHNMLEVRLLYKKLARYNKVLESYNRMLGQTLLEQTSELGKSEARFRCLAELSSDWYWEQDEYGHFTTVAGPVLEMLGIGFDNDQGNTGELAAGTRWIETERGTLEAHMAARRPFLDLLYSRTSSEGKLQYLKVSGEPIFLPSGHFCGYRGIGKDVTQGTLRNQR